MYKLIEKKVNDLSDKVEERLHNIEDHKQFGKQFKWYSSNITKFFICRYHKK